MFKPVMTAAALVVLSTSCIETRTIPNADFCTNALGDQTCVERFPDGSRPYCVVAECLDDFYGCFPYEPAPECASPCGLESTDCMPGETTVGTESGTASGSTTEDPSGSETSSETESSTTGPQPCVTDEECTDAAAPFCGPGGECVACDGMADPDAACAGADPGEPLCVDGACVQCTVEDPSACTGMTPVCDGASNSCVPCTAHDQCGEAACNLFTGACLPAEADAIAHVGPGQEFATLALALASIPAGGEGTLVVHQADYNEGVLVNGDRTVAFLAAEGDLPLWLLGGGGAPQLTVVTGGTALVDGLRLSGNATDRGVRVNGGRAWVDRSRIVQNAGGGVVAENGADLILRNCFVGGDISDVDALAVDGATADIIYTTMAGGFGIATALGCDVTAVVSVRSSLLVARTDSDEIVCDATIEHSATELALGGSNVALGDMSTTWFTAYGTGGFGLTAMHPAAIDTAAQWQAGDPPTDIDGDPRPAVDGTPDYAGADVL